MNNCVHGEINTAGCWMLFRNYNWPREQFEAFEEAYRTVYRNEQQYPPHPRYRAQLVELGYATDGVCTDENWAKAIYWDANRAYTRFVRHIVGVQYFSRHRSHSLYNTDGRRFHPLATQEYRAAVVPVPNGHDFQRLVDSNQPEDRAIADAAGISRLGDDSVIAHDSLFDDSRLHFKRQQRWAPTRTRDRVTHVEECSWADVLLFV